MFVRTVPIARCQACSISRSTVRVDARAAVWAETSTSSRASLRDRLILPPGLGRLDDHGDRGPATDPAGWLGGQRLLLSAVGGAVLSVRAERAQRRAEVSRRRRLQ